jgi:hypothetical protein
MLLTYTTTSGASRTGIIVGFRNTRLSHFNVQVGTRLISPGSFGIRIHACACDAARRAWLAVVGWPTIGCRCSRGLRRCGACDMQLHVPDKVSRVIPSAAPPLATFLRSCKLDALQPAANATCLSASVTPQASRHKPLTPSRLHVLHSYTDGIPGKVGLPLLNDDLWIGLKRGSNNLALLSRERRKKYGDIYRNRFLGEVVVTVASLEDAKRVLASEHVLVEGAWKPLFTSPDGALSPPQCPSVRVSCQHVMRCLAQHLSQLPHPPSSWASCLHAPQPCRSWPPQVTPPPYLALPSIPPSHTDSPKTTSAARPSGWLSTTCDQCAQY